VDDKSNPIFKKNWTQMLTEMFNFKPRKASRYLKDGEVIDLGSVTVDVIHAPGHSPGNIALFFQEPEILYLSDYDLTPFGPWYGDRYSDIDQIIETVNRLRKIPAKIWLTAHEHGIFESNPGDGWDKYLSVINTREEKLLDFLKEPKTIKEIGEAWIVYGKPIKPIENFELMEQISMRKHAERLIKQGRVCFQEGKYHMV
jgi:hydroxyacylglutathione hydrolase